MSYNEDLHKASTLLNQGKVRKAYVLLQQLRQERADAEVVNLQGICLRLLGRLDESLEMFSEAIALAGGGSREQLGRFTRDKGMVYLDRGDRSQAQSCFSRSIDLFDIPYNQVEQAVSVGFLGRATKGRHGKNLLRKADKALRGHRPYELNNLIWLMSRELPIARWRLVKRALQLARESQNRGRVVEIWALTIGGSHVHAAIKRMHRRLGCLK